MPFYSIKVKIVPPKGLKPITLSGIAFGNKGGKKEAEGKAVEQIKTSFSTRFPDMKLNYIVVETNKIKEDFFVKTDE